MNVIGPSTPGGYTLFCEDIRKENNGKRIYLGVFTGSMLLTGEFPMAIPSLKIVVTYLERPGESEEPVKIRVFLPGARDGDSATEVEIVPAGKRPEPRLNRPSDRPENEKNDPIKKWMKDISISPAVFQHAGEIRVRAYRGNDVIKLGALRVGKKPDPKKV